MSYNHGFTNVEVSGKHVGVGAGEVMVLINEIQRAFPFYLQGCIKMARDF